MFAIIPKILEIIYFHIAFKFYDSIFILPNLVLKILAYLIFLHYNKLTDIVCVVCIWLIFEYVLFIFPENVRKNWKIKKNQKIHFYPIYFSLLVFIIYAYGKYNSKH